MQETFLNYRNYRWLWIALIFTSICIVAYIIDSPVEGRSGNSYLGYTLGTIATIGIVYLMWYGLRKRSYNAKLTTLQGVLSSHVWIGVALLVIVPLHSAFSFGWNVHTLAYALLVATVLSGIWGVVMFYSLPQSLKSQRGGGTTKQLAASLFSLNSEIEEFIASRSTSSSDGFLKLAETLNIRYRPSLRKALRRKNPAQLQPKETAKLLEPLPIEEQKDALTLIELANKKRLLVTNLQNEARAQAMVRGWLFAHLPLSIALCVAVAIHILAVFYYR